MPELMTNLAELVTEINRIDPALEDPLRHAKRECKRLATAILEHAVAEAWSALRVVSAMEDADMARTDQSDASAEAAQPGAHP